jgi:integrase
MLTDLKIRNAKPQDRPYKLPAGKGLYLEVRPTGKKLWRYRYRLEDVQGIKRENLYAIGEYGKGGPDRGQFTLEQAEQERARARELVKAGKHPSHERRERRSAVVEAQANTFRAVALAWIEENKPTWTPYYLKQIERGFREDVYPAIGELPISAINAAHLLKIVKDKAKTAPTVALLLRQWMGAVFRYAVAHLLATTDPTFAIRGTVKRAPVQNKRPLVGDEIPAFRDALAKSGGYRPTVIALNLLLHTFTRPGELRMAKWPEFDLDAALWRIPAARMKMGEAHTVPLSSQAVVLLRELRGITGAQEWLFPNLRDPKRPMTATTLNRALERMGYAGRLSAHGFRATASTWLNEAGFRHDVIEKQLAHKERNAVRASYNKAEYLPERREMMARWSDAVEAMGTGAKIVPIGARAA